jgi:site-specific recombinase XerD
MWMPAHTTVPPLRVARSALTTSAPTDKRLFLEERRRTKIIPHAFGERAVLKLMYASLIRASETWRRVVISEFELKQLDQLREDLGRRHAERVAPIMKTASRSRISSSQRT